MIYSTESTTLKKLEKFVNIERPLALLSDSLKNIFDSGVHISHVNQALEVVVNQTLKKMKPPNFIKICMI